jgi:asparagine synthase (glutamine-hydrolysing)
MNVQPQQDRWGMCGVAGIWQYDGGEVDRSAVASMLAPIAHRGPDGGGIWQQGRAALGHQRLSILDLTEAASQPMLTPCGNGALTYNGEVYNYRELRDELEREGIKFRSTGDTEVVLQALHHWGPERALPKFDGMFAFGYYDRSSGALWLARDRVGIKPLLAADTGTEFIFGSEAKALLAHPRMQRRVNRYALAKWILSRGLWSNDTLFAGIESLEPGAYWRVSESGIEKRQYFHVLNAVDVDRLVAASIKDPNALVDEFRDLLKRSVELYLASDAPLATTCSGGVDSSLVAAFAREAKHDIGGYVADVMWKGGEGNQAERVAKHLGIPIRRIRVDRARFLELWPLALWHSDRPSIRSSDPALLAVAEACREDGIKVLLTGEGSDELFGGYGWHQSTYEAWSRPASWWSRLMQSGNTRKPDAHAPFSNLIAWENGKLRSRFAIALDTETELLPKRLMSLLAAVEPEADRALIAHGLFDLYQLLSWILDRHDRMGMAASIEMRVPFLENELFDFAFHLPRRAKLHDKTGKWVVKQAAARLLPSDIVFAPKVMFRVPNRFSSGAEQLLVGGTLPEMLGWQEKTTRDIVDSLADDGSLRFNLISLELWARMFFAGEPPAALADRLAALMHDRGAASAK